jgi:photosystem II stability/assembly factor-like uncharacterized protein
MRNVSFPASKPVLILATVATALIATASASAAPQRITAARITRPPGTLAPGTGVRASSLGQRVFPNASHGFALADVGGAQYPAATTNGGRTWKTDGPALHLNAAQAPLAVVDVGARNTRTFFAFGGGQVVDVTSDGGRTWWRAFLGDVVLAVVPRLSGGLTAISQDAGSRGSAVTLVYISTDGGKHWRLSHRFGQA